MSQDSSLCSFLNSAAITCCGGSFGWSWARLFMRSTAFFALISGVIGGCVCFSVPSWTTWVGLKTSVVDRALHSSRSEHRQYCRSPFLFFECWVNKNPFHESMGFDFAEFTKVAMFNEQIWIFFFCRIVHRFLQLLCYCVCQAVVALLI